MSDYSELWQRFEHHGAERFETFAEWAREADLPGKLGPYYVENADGSWWPEAFRTFKAMRARGLGFVGKSLPFPEARTAADLFTAARLIETPRGGLYRHEAEAWVAERAGGPGFCFVSASRGAFAIAAHLGGKRDWSPDWLKRGEKIRRQSGAKFYGTYTQPRPELRAAWGETVGTDGEWALNSFEAVTRDGGEVLIIGRSYNGFGNRWLALLDPGANLLDLMPQADRDFYAAEKAAEAEAWGEA